MKIFVQKLGKVSFRRDRVGKSTAGFVILPTSLGMLLLVGSSVGLQAVALADREDEFDPFLDASFPRRQRSVDAELTAWARALKAFIEGDGPMPTLPLDAEGTPFQKEVWRHLQTIPMGETISYLALAKRMGRPKAVRAVARACGANPIAIVVPCHRVVGSDGSLTGYRWGVARKRKLLEREQSAGLTSIATTS